MEHIEYRGFRITPRVQPAESPGQWLLDPKIYHTDPKDTVFHNAGDLAGRAECRVEALDEASAMQSCVTFARQLIDEYLSAST